MANEIKNLLANLPKDLPTELFEQVLSSRNLRIERIVSTGHCSPADFWYEQEEHEWIVLLSGAATLTLIDSHDGERINIELGPADCLNIPAGQKHRVEKTSGTEPTVWLAVFYKD